MAKLLSFECGVSRSACLMGRERQRERGGVTTNLYAYGCHGYARSNFNCNFRSSSTSTFNSNSNSGCDPTFQFKVAQPRLKDNSS